MQDEEFEWDGSNAASHFVKHAVSFDGFTVKLPAASVLLAAAALEPAVLHPVKTG